MNKSFNKSAIVILQFIIILVFTLIMSSYLTTMPYNGGFGIYLNNIQIWEYLMLIATFLGFILIFGGIALLACSMFYFSLKKHNNLNVFTIIMSLIAPFISLIKFESSVMVFYFAGIVTYCVVMLIFFITLVAKNPTIIKKKQKE